MSVVAADSVQVNNKNDGVELTVHSNSPGQQILLNGKAIADGKPTDKIGLGVNGVSTQTIAIKAQDGKGNITYTLQIARMYASLDGTLSNLVCHCDGNKCQGPLSPAFSPDIKEYFTWLDHSKQNVWVTPSVTQPIDTKLTVNTKDCQNGKDSEHFSIKDLKPGGDRFDVKTEVTAQNTGVKVDYVLHVAKLPDPPPANSALLAALITDTGALSPTFDMNHFDYTVALETNKVKVMPIAFSRTVSLLEVNGKKINSGASSDAFDVKTDGTPTNITVEVLSEDKSSDQKYHVSAVYKTEPGVASISGLKLDPGGVGAPEGGLTPAFAPHVRDYSAHFLFGASKVTITPTCTDGSALAVDGAPVESGSSLFSAHLVGPCSDPFCRRQAHWRARCRRRRGVPRHRHVGEQAQRLHVLRRCARRLQRQPQGARNLGRWTRACVRPDDDGVQVRAAVWHQGHHGDAHVRRRRRDHRGPPRTALGLETRTRRLSTFASLQVDGKAVKSGAASEGIDVSKPNTKITIAVKSKDGRTTLNYEIDCTNVPPSTDATLKELAIAPGGLDPKFDPKVRT